MYVPEEWLSSTEPGLQIDSQLFFSTSSHMTICRWLEEVTNLRNHFKYESPVF